MLGSKGKAALLLLLAGLLGAGLGAWAAREFGRHGPGRGRWHGPEGYVRLLDRELDLSPAQEDSVRAILRRSAGAMESLWAAVRPRFDSLRTVIRAEVRAQLTPEQQARYQDLVRRLDAERRRHDTEPKRP
ncbi:MAG TPA: periplasmic heavy metal sensor [Gemmatimonadales bacterium]|jgi:Spy/CpxP family protein refolding chaperone|nr:periplasmic heavy metal sensor [Gemmatimonadales bacterium]